MSTPLPNRPFHTPLKSSCPLLITVDGSSYTQHHFDIYLMTYSQLCNSSLEAPSIVASCHRGSPHIQPVRWGYELLCPSWAHCCIVTVEPVPVSWFSKHHFAGRLLLVSLVVSCKPHPTCLYLVAHPAYRIHPFVTPTCSWELWGLLEPLPVIRRKHRGTTQTSCQLIAGPHRDIQLFALTPTGNWQFPIDFSCMFSDNGRKPEYPVRTHKDTGRTFKLQAERPKARSQNHDLVAVKWQR